MPLVTSGVEKGNLRELALARMEDLGLKCRDVRTREAGIQVNTKYRKPLSRPKMDVLIILAVHLYVGYPSQDQAR